MTAPLVVRVETATPRLSETLPVLAALPARFQRSQTLAPDVVLSSFRNDPLADLARSLDARALALTDIGAATPSGLADLQRTLAGRPAVVLSLAGRGLTRPQIDRLSPEATETLLIVDGQATVSGEDPADLREGVLELITLLESLTGPGWAYERLSLHANRLVLTGRRDGAAIARLYCAFGAPSVSLTTVSRQTRRTVRLHPSPHARPAEAVVFDAAGAASLPLLFEAGARRDWGALHSALTDGVPLSLDAWVDRVRRLDAALTP